MEKRKALQYVDEWANLYLKIFGDAKHMEMYDNGRYTLIQPKAGENGPTSIFNIRLECLNDNELSKTVHEIKTMNHHTWWNQYSDRVNKVIFPEGRHECSPDDWEVYAVMTPEEIPTYSDNKISVRRVETTGDFNTWLNLNHDNGLQPNHFHLCQKGILRCYIGYAQNKPVSVVAMLKNNRIYSLEFASTLNEYQKRGFATAICQTAIKEAIHDGADVITARAYEESKLLGKKLGFVYI